jgi:hypothetical protein
MSFYKPNHFSHDFWLCNDFEFVAVTDGWLVRDLKSNTSFHLPDADHHLINLLEKHDEDKDEDEPCSDEAKRYPM